MSDAAADLARALRAAGTGVAFGVPGGGANLELVAACREAGIRFALMRGETSAVIAAAACADVGGAPGLAICTRGPGLAAAVCGIAHARLDRLPVVVATDGAGHAHPHQRIDHAALGRPVAKGTVRDASAVALALAPPAGPVIFDMHGPARDDAQEGSSSWSSSDAASATAGDPFVVPGTRPAIVAGVGARGAAAALRDAVDGRRIPVLTTYRAKGVIPERWPNAAGLFAGAPPEGRVLEQADAIVLVGVDPVELLAHPWPYAAPVLWLADVPLADRGQLPAGDELRGPLAAALARLVLDDTGWSADGQTWRTALLRELDVRVAGLAPQDVVRRARAVLPTETVATVDSGAHMLVAMPFWDVDDHRRCLISSGLATMGFALPAAIGASFATDAPIVCFTGDGGLGMCLAELETLARLGADVRVVVFNDASLSLIRAKQAPGTPDGAAVTHRVVDFAAIARACGIAGSIVTTLDGLDGALRARGPSLLDVRIDASGYPAVLDATRAASPAGAGSPGTGGVPSNTPRTPSPG